MAESLIEEGYIEDYIIEALEDIEPIIHPSLQPETPVQIERVDRAASATLGETYFGG